jgi:hypothetical protein
MKSFLSTAFLAQFVPKLHQYVFEHLLVMTSTDIKKDDKAVFTEIGHLVQELLVLIWNEAKLEEAIDRFNLDVALKSFMSTI